MIYLVQYDRTSGQLVRIREFAAESKRESEQARLAVELELLKSGTAQEIVLLEASSEDELRKTHRRYFEGLNELITEMASRPSATN